MTNDPKPPISPARLAANQANARKSTGPKTVEGKAKSRLNGLTHGLRAEVPILPGEDPEALQQRLDALTADLRPATAIEALLVQKLALASVQMDRCRGAEAAALTAQVLRAEDDFDLRQAEEVGRLAARLADEPALAVAQLHMTTAGCRWMFRRWEALMGALMTTGALERTDAQLALRLLGKRPSDYFTDLIAQRWVLAHVATLGDGAEDGAAAVEALLTFDRPEGMRDDEFARRARRLVTLVPELYAARESLRQAIQEAIDELLGHAESVVDRDAQSRAQAAHRAAFDASKEGTLRHRYEMAHERSFHKALRDLHAEQKRRRMEEEEAPTEVGAGPEAPTEPEARAEAPTEPKPERPETIVTDEKRPPEGRSAAGGGVRNPRAA